MLLLRFCVGLNYETTGRMAVTTTDRTLLENDPKVNILYTQLFNESSIYFIMPTLKIGARAIDLNLSLEMYCEYCSVWGVNMNINL